MLAKYVILYGNIGRWSFKRKQLGALSKPFLPGRQEEMRNPLQLRVTD